MNIYFVILIISSIQMPVWDSVCLFFIQAVVRVAVLYG